MNFQVWKKTLQEAQWIFTYFSNEMTSHGNFSWDPSQKESPFLGEFITWSSIMDGNYQQDSHVNTYLTLGLNYKDPELGPTDKWGCGSAGRKRESHLYAFASYGIWIRDRVSKFWKPGKFSEKYGQESGKLFQHQRVVWVIMTSFSFLVMSFVFSF